MQNAIKLENISNLITSPSSLILTINIISFIFFYYRESKPPFCLQYEKISPVNIVYRKINWQNPASISAYIIFYLFVQCLIFIHRIYRREDNNMFPFDMCKMSTYFPKRLDFRVVEQSVTHWETSLTTSTSLGLTINFSR
jgi:hypothetical protein